MNERIIMHIDMNAFFASVEQQANPALRGKPIAVIGSAKRTIITTSSYEARAYGVKTGMTIWEARQKCPQIILVIGDNRKMLLFPIDQVPEMARGRGVRLQKYRDGGLSDVATFNARDGLTWKDSAGREFSATIKELAEWRGNRADAGRLPPKGFPKSNKFGRGVE